jgi:hypothetical protein
MAMVEIPREAQELVRKLAEPRPMRRGSVSQRWVKCSKPGCACGQKPDARHGPYYSLTQAEAGKTRSRFLTAQQAAMVRGQVEAGREFRRWAEEYLRTCEKWADRELATSGEAASETEAAKKGGSKKPSRRKSAPRSRRS